jgi:hypothetical protein
VASWPTVADAVANLRTFLNDGPQDRLVKQKIVVGAVDGVNTQFFTFEDRIIGSTLVVTVSFVPVAVTVNDEVTGEFHTATAPDRDATVRAQYFYRYFLDQELEVALQATAEQLLGVDDVTQTPGGMKLAALHYAGAFAYQKQAMRWMERLSHKFLLEEEPLQNEALARSNMFKDMANTLLKNGEHFRDDYYKTQGRQLRPAFRVFRPRIGVVGTSR